MFHQADVPQDIFIACAVPQNQSSQASVHTSQRILHVSRLFCPSSAPPAAVPPGSHLGAEDVSVRHKELLVGAEDDDVVCCGGQDEEEHFKLKTHPQEDSTGDQRQDAAGDRVLGGRERLEVKSSIDPRENLAGLTVDLQTAHCSLFQLYYFHV